MASDDNTRQQHDVTIPQSNIQNIDDEDNRQIDSEDVENIDDNYRTGFGNDPDDKTIGEAVDEDEIAIVKDLSPRKQKKHK